MSWFFRLLIRHKSVSFITIENIRVAIALRIVQALVVLYSVHSIYLSRGYMKIGTPQGTSNGYVSSWSMPDADETRVYCNNNPDYDFVWAPGWEYVNNTCRDFANGEVARKLPGGGLYVQTYVQEQLHVKSGCGNGGGRCVNETLLLDRNYFVPNVENVVVSFDHVFNLDNLSGMNVPTVLQFANGTKYTEFDAGESITLSLDEVFEVAEIGSLDDVNRAAEVAASTGTPRYRLTGVTLVVNIHYSNLHDIYGKETKAVVTILNRSPGWGGVGTRADVLEASMDDNGAVSGTVKSDYSYGVLMNVQFTGDIGVPDVFSFFDACVTSSVMLAGATFCADFVAEYFAGDVSRLFKEKKREQIGASVIPTNRNNSARGSDVVAATEKQ